MTRLAWANAIVHVVGLVLAATVMERAYLDHAPEHAGVMWKIAWAWWAMAALVLLALMSALMLSGRTGVSLWMAAIAMALAGAAVTNDLSADFFWIFHYPDNPAGHRSLVVKGAVLANGLYSAAVLFMGYRRMALSLAVFSCGVLFSLSAALEWRLATRLFSGGTILLYSYWGIVMARADA